MPFRTSKKRNASKKSDKRTPAASTASASVGMLHVNEAVVADDRPLKELLDELPQGAFVGTMAPEDVNRVHAWFNDYIDGLDSAIVAIDTVIDAVPIQEVQRLSDLRLGLSMKKTDAQQKQDAFDASNAKLRPPSPELIQRTQALTTEMAKTIAQAKTAQAIVAFVDDLAAILLKLNS